MMSQMNVMVVEDEPTIRISRVADLTARGFRAWGPSTADDVREVSKRLKGDFHVVLLDMKLDHWDDGAIRGVDGSTLGLEIKELRRQLSPWTPEFLVVSGWRDREYLEGAIKLGVAAYLHKLKVSRDEVIRHVRALALRHELSMDRPEAFSRIQRIAESSRSRGEAVTAFCREVLVPSLKSTMGLPFKLVIMVGDETACLDENGGCGGDPIGLTTITALVHGRVGRQDPVRLTHDILGSDPNPTTAAELARFVGSAAIPLALENDVRLSLALGQPNCGTHVLDEDAVGLARVASEYIRPPVLAHVMRIWARFAEQVEHRRTLLLATSKLLSYVGNEQIAVLTRPADNGPEMAADPRIEDLRRLGEDLRATGALLARLDEPYEAVSRDTVSTAECSLRDVVTAAWGELVDDGFADPGQLAVLGDCHAHADYDDLYFTVSRLLLWFAERAHLCGSITPSSIRVHSQCDTDRAVVVFEDESPRLPAALRLYLFAPFSQTLPVPKASWDPTTARRPGQHLPLYLAKMLIVMRNRGTLEDYTDRLPMEQVRGHRLVLTLPAAAGYSRGA